MTGHRRPVAPAVIRAHDRPACPLVPTCFQLEDQREDTMDVYSLATAIIADKDRSPQMDARAEDLYYSRHTIPHLRTRLFTSLATVAVICLVLLAGGLPD